CSSSAATSRFVILRPTGCDGARLVARPVRACIGTLWARIERSAQDALRAYDDRRTKSRRECRRAFPMFDRIEDDALEDVRRLARGMTYKAALAGLDLGGGKAVIIGDPARDKSEALLRAFARYVDALGGRYITAEDVGTTQADMDLIRR